MNPPPPVTRTRDMETIYPGGELGDLVGIDEDQLTLLADVESFSQRSESDHAK